MKSPISNLKLFAFKGFPADVAGSIAKNAIYEALDVWAKSADVVFREVRNVNDADLVFAFEKDGIDDDYPNTFAQTKPGPQTEITFDMLDEWSMEPASKGSVADFFSLALHEIGHFMGLTAHEDHDAKSVVFRTYTGPKHRLATIDISKVVDKAGPAVGKVELPFENGCDDLFLMPSTQKVELFEKTGTGFRTTQSTSLRTWARRKPINLPGNISENLPAIARLGGQIAAIWPTEDGYRFRFDIKGIEREGGKIEVKNLRPSDDGRLQFLNGTNNWRLLLWKKDSSLWQSRMDGKPDAKNPIGLNDFIEIKLMPGFLAQSVAVFLDELWVVSKDAVGELFLSQDGDPSDLRKLPVKPVGAFDFLPFQKNWEMVYWQEPGKLARSKFEFTRSNPVPVLNPKSELYFIENTQPTDRLQLFVLNGQLFVAIFGSDRLTFLPL